MKLKNLLEADVTNLAAFRNDREEQKRQDINKRLHDIRMQYLDEITISAAAAVDQLTEAGMPKHGAAGIVIQHLENLAENIGLMNETD